MSENVKSNIFTRIGRFAVEVRNELKRVIWPTWPHVVSNTFTVLALCLIFGVIIWSADYAFGFIQSLVYGKA